MLLIKKNYKYSLVYIEEEYKNRKEKIKSGDKDGESNIDKNSGFKNFSPYYLIFCDNYKTIKKESMVDMLLKSDINVGFTFYNYCQ